MRQCFPAKQNFLGFRVLNVICSRVLLHISWMSLESANEEDAETSDLICIWNKYAIITNKPHINENCIILLSEMSIQEVAKLWGCWWKYTLQFCFDHQTGYDPFCSKCCFFIKLTYILLQWWDLGIVTIVSCSQTFRLTAGIDDSLHWSRSAHKAIWLTCQTTNHSLFRSASRFRAWKCCHNNSVWNSRKNLKDSMPWTLNILHTFETPAFSWPW